MKIAGLWIGWKSPNEETLRSYTTLTINTVLICSWACSISLPIRSVWW